MRRRIEWRPSPRWVHILCVAGCLWLASSTVAVAQSVSIQLSGTTFSVAGWAPPRNAPAGGWASVFAVYAGTGDVPPLLGTYAVERGTLTFHPRFPFAPGVRYRAVFHPPGGARIEKVFDGPRRSTTPTTRVERVYPSGDVWPSNQLRVYIYFSAPMSRGEADARIHLLDAHGRVLSGVFLPGEELWDPDIRRLTMTFDPGRIKRGLTSNEKMGPPIAAGERYTLVVDGGWPDATGAPLVEAFRKPFRGGPADRHAPDPKEWMVTPPRAGTSSPLVVDFPDPMNYPLLARMLRVTAGQAAVPGTVGVERHETRWTFTPRTPWNAGVYQLVIDTNLEDLAGNHIGQLFDIDVFEHVTGRITSHTVSRPFTVR